MDEQDYLRMGDVYLSDDSIVEAIEAYEKSIAVSPCPDPGCPVHDLCFKSRIMEEVFPRRSESRLADPRYLETLASLAAESPQEHDRSLVPARYNECLRSRAGFSKTHQALCGLYLSQGNLQKALSEILAALRVDPEDGPARYLQGCVYSRMHDPRLAIQALETCLRSSPYHKQASDLLSELRQASPDR
jgi:tetratricopeptide (TPR) repeat protein